MSKKLKFFTLTILTIASVASVRNLSTCAFIGPQLIFFFLIGSLFFLLPVALITGALASHTAKGGIYNWVSRAFGSNFGFIAVWFQWVASLSWCPLALSFFAGMFLYSIDPELVARPHYFVTTVILSYLLMTVINIFGLRISGKITSFLSIMGLFLPLLVLFCFFVERLIANPTTFLSHGTGWIPSFDFSFLVPLSTIILSLCGIESSSVHLERLSFGKKSYFFALFFSVLTIPFIFVVGSLSILAVVEHEKLSLSAGLSQAIHAYLEEHGWLFILPFFSFSIALGAFSGINSWVLALAKGISKASEECGLKPFLARENRFGAPYVVLIMQGSIVILLSLLFTLMPSINSSFWMLTSLSSEAYMMMYLFLFAAAFRLKRNLSIGGLSLLGGSFAVFTIVSGFFPSSELPEGHFLFYRLFLLGGLVFYFFLPFLFLQRRDTGFSQD